MSIFSNIQFWGATVSCFFVCIVNISSCVLEDIRLFEINDGFVWRKAGIIFTGLNNVPMLTIIHSLDSMAGTGQFVQTLYSSTMLC